MTAPVLVYCAGGNRRFDEVALAAEYRLGARLPRTIYHPIWMADQDWRRPDRTTYMRALAEHRPTVATVLDWEREDQLSEVLDWAEEASQYVERVMIVPKVIGGIGRLPRRIGGAEVVLAYSVPTRFGGSPVCLWELEGWPVHLLGGSPQAQMRCWGHLSSIAEVVSVDGNMAQRMATRWCQFWVDGSADYASNRWWPTLTEADGRRWAGNGPYEAFRRSCINIQMAWGHVTGG